MCVRACVRVRTCARLRVRVRSHVRALHVLMPEHASKHMLTDMHMHMLHDNFPAEWPAYTFAGTTRAPLPGNRAAPMYDHRHMRLPSPRRAVQRLLEMKLADLPAVGAGIK